MKFEVRNMEYKFESAPKFWFFILGSFFVVLFTSQNTIAQESPKVEVAIDTASIKIGEQIQYKITVETDSTDLVYFPEEQTFSPLEMVEALKIDTTKNKNRMTLQRIYALTQFDSGAYTIPQQRIAINEQPFLTDSFRITVVDVAVDTTKQKMFDIKPLIEVDKSRAELWWTLLWVLLGLLVAAFLIYWFLLRKKPLTEEEKVALLPPFDRAILQLQELENSRYLIQDDYKGYYSELTNIVRSYLEEDAHVTALESTTDQLITKLGLLKDAGELDLQDETIDEFKRILQTADLVKFAKSKPSTTAAEQDRNKVEQIVRKTKEALPEPTEEELLLDQEYLEELERKKRRKKIYTAAAIFAGLIVLAMGATIYRFGFDTVKDTLLRHPTKSLLEKEWVASAYGYPPMTLETPGVLVRVDGEFVSNMLNLDTVNNAAGQMAKKFFKDETNLQGLKISEFMLTEGKDDYYLKYEDLTAPALDSVSLEKEAQVGIDQFSKQDRISNIIVKTDVFETPMGAEGLKQYGTLNLKDSDGELQKKKYTILNFMRPGNFKRLFLIWDVDDTYAEKITERILASVEIKAEY